MNAQTSINLTALIEREGIDRIRHYRALEKFSVVLIDGRLGIGPTVGEALEQAKSPDAQNVLRWAA